MNLIEFKEAIFRALLEAQGLGYPAERRGLGPGPEPSTPEIDSTRRLREQLISQAFQNGFPELPDYNLRVDSLSGGAVTQHVDRLSPSPSFVCKVDNSPELARQALTLQFLRGGLIIPAGHRELFPKVYSVILDGPPFGYLMEDFGQGYTWLVDHLFKENSPLSPESVAASLADVVFSLAENTRNSLLIPNLRAIYIARMGDRLAAAKNRNERFRRLAENPICINGHRYLPYEEYLAAIATGVDRMPVQFSSFVHGDLHPGNVFFRTHESHVEFKFIDPKAWIWGDYIFDLGKLLHYTMVTGPLEDAGQVGNLAEPDGPEINYEIRIPDAGKTTIAVVEERLSEFAPSVGDENFRQRLTLSLASNLLGLCENRLAKGHYKNAVLFYCEGLRYLRQLAEELR